MKRLTAFAFVLLTVIAAHCQAVGAKQAHAMLDNIVMGDRAALEKAQVSVTLNVGHSNGITLKTVEVINEGKQTYVATYDATGRLVDGMLVATDGDVKQLRTESDNEYVWFVPQGEAKCVVSADSVMVTRRYDMKMKPLSNSYIRHSCTVTCRYVVNTDGTFEQLPVVCENYQIEGSLDADGQELPPTSCLQVQPSLNTTSLKVMSLLYSPISNSSAAMEEWIELGAYLYQRMDMTGVPDCEFWSANYYTNNIAPMLAQGDSRKMVWFYQHYGTRSFVEAWAVLYGGDYNRLSNYIPISDNHPSFYQILKQSAKRLSDKKARQWWKEALK